MCCLVRGTDEYEAMVEWWWTGVNGRKWRNKTARGALRYVGHVHYQGVFTSEVPYHVAVQADVSHVGPRETCSLPYADVVGTDCVLFEESRKSFLIIWSFQNDWKAGSRWLACYLTGCCNSRPIDPYVLGWTQWHWNRFFSQYFSFPMSVSFHQCCIPIHSPTTDTV